MYKFYKSIIIIIFLTMSVVLSVVTVQANNIKPKYNRSWTNHLASAGYAYKIPGKKDTYRVIEVKSIRNGATALIQSKQTRRKRWVNPITTFYNINVNKKALKNLINAELKVINEPDSKRANQKLEQVQKIAKKLKGNNKEIANQSIKQLKNRIKNPVYANIPALLVGTYPGKIR
ncbi:MAG: hypothetical protein M3005_02625 [Apilactobacillus sp.]|uniref:hypothetical protein n=1 Tax=Apilactobacillus TaxID=2767877 RepID=UPI0025FF0E69|nr:hypothetical protein [Apilactobacillus sp.]MCT6822747.1 hypothetical protein [Apilactobacillus sp.]MCT6858215.1 hypothetical protein [Apilactobacillus sp.]